MAETSYYGGKQRKKPAFEKRLPDGEAIKAAIYKAGRLEEFCREFLPAGRRERNEWVCGAVDGSKGKSFTMCLSGPYQGVGWERAGGEKYDIIDCIEASQSMTRKEAMALARTRLNMPIEEIAASERPIVTAEELEIDARKKAKRIDDAKRIWGETADIIGTAAETYLRRRGIERSLPISLRFHPRLGYWDIGDDNKPVFVGNFPALVAMVQRADGSFCGIHRIYLAPGGIDKADVGAPKKALGDIDGGAIRCCDDDEIVGEIGITEGIEDALSIPSLYDGQPAWAAVSAVGIRKLILPEWVTHPVFYPDNDPPQRKKNGELRLNRNGQPIYPGLDACTEAVARLKSETCFPRITRIRGGKDANAVLMAESGLVL